MKRLLAVVLAVLLVGGAVVLRSRLDGDDGGGGGGGDDGPTAAASVSCVTEVFAACQAATGNVATQQTAGAALDRLLVEPLTPATSAIEAWVLPRYLVQAVEAQRARMGAPPAFGEVSDTVAWTEVVPAGVPDRLAALAASCGAVDWACVANDAGALWAELGATFPGTVKVGLDPPLTSATGLVALGAMTTAALGPFDPSLTDTQAWVSDLLRSQLAAAPSGQTALATLATRAGTYDVAAAIGADAVKVAANNPRVGVATPAPAAVLEVVVASAADRRLDRDLAKGVATQLKAAGWQDGATPASLVPAGDVLVALRSIQGR